MSHEQSETIQTQDGRWINIYGKSTPNAGKQLPGTTSYQTIDEAVSAAKSRSESSGSQRFEITAPDGRRFEITAPQGATQDQVLAYAQSQMGQSNPATGADRIKALQGGLYRGAAGVAGLPMDTVQNAYNLLKAGAGTVATAAGRPDLAPELTTGTPLSSEWIANQMQKLGINTRNPRPDDPASRMLFTGGVVGGGSMIPGANLRPSSVLPAAGAAAVAGEVSDNPLAPAVASMIPAAANAGVTAARNAVATKAQPTLQTFRDVGAQPSAGQVTGSVFLHGLENLAAKFPGGAGVMKGFIEAQQRQIGATARTGVSAEAAGRAIESGVTSTGGFLDRTRATWQKLDNAVAQKIPKTAAFAPANTVQALDDLTRPIQGAEKTTGGLVNPKVAAMHQNIVDDLTANNGVMPFEALRSLRSKVGSMIDDSLVSGIPSGEMKKLYGALSKDLEAAANQAGAGPEFARQNNYYRARMDRIENVLDRVIGKGRQPEDIFKTVNPTDPDQANKLRSVMRSLDPTERKTVTDAVVNRLGRAAPGKQSEVGDIFSSNTFLTNWNRLSAGAKQQLFPNPPMRENVERIARAASNIRTGSGIYANPSGTAGSFAAYSVYSSPIVSVASGSVIPLAAAGGAMGSAYVGSKMLTNPKIVEWLATPVQPANPGAAAAHLVRLGLIYNAEKDPEVKSEIEQFISRVGQR